MRIESALALQDDLHGAVAPRPDQRRDPRCPRPLAHAVEALAVAHVVAVDELVVAEDVAVGVQDALRQARRAGGVVELRRVVGGGVDGLEVRRTLGEVPRFDLDDLREPLDPRPVGRVRHDDRRLRVVEAMRDPLVAVEHGHREQDRPRLPRPEERGGRLGRRRQQHRDAIAALHAVLAQQQREAVGHVLQLAPCEFPDVAVGVLVDHRELVARVFVADVRGDVVALGNLPRVPCARLLVSHAVDRTAGRDSVLHAGEVHAETRRAGTRVRAPRSAPAGDRTSAPPQHDDASSACRRMDASRDGRGLRRRHGTVAKSTSHGHIS